MGKTITIAAKNYLCICGRRGEYLNIDFDRKYGNALCTKCRDKALQEERDIKAQKTTSQKDSGLNSN